MGRHRGTRAPRIAIVVPCFNEGETLVQTIPILKGKLGDLIAASRCDQNSIIVFVDDGSTDCTWDLVKAASCKASGSIIGIRLAINAGHQNALMAALDFVADRVEASISIDADLQDSLASLEDMLAAYQDGAEIVFGVRRSREADTVFKRITAAFFYRFMRLMGVDAIEQHADYRLLSRAAMRNLRQFPEYHLFLRGLATRLHNRVAVVEYERLPRTAGHTKYSLRKMLSLALRGITSFSTYPLRAISVVGFIVFSIGLLLATYAVISSFAGATVPGWASISAPLYALGGIIMLSIGILGEYVGKIYEQVKARPRYLVDEIAGDE